MHTKPYAITFAIIRETAWTTSVSNDVGGVFMQNSEFRQNLERK